ncbi:MAG: ethylbenzene dehydrogenase-related protein [bacterium]
MSRCPVTLAALLPLLLATPLALAPVAAHAEDPNAVPPGEIYEDPDGLFDEQGMAITDQDVEDYPSHATEEFAVALIRNKEPRLDGHSTEEVWEAVPPRDIALHKVSDPSGAPVATLRFRAFHNGHQLYVCVDWNDATYDDSDGAWMWNGTKSKYTVSKEREDSFTLLFKTYGDFWGDRLKGVGFVADEWRWGASLTNMSGYAEDGWRFVLRNQDNSLRQIRLTGEDGRPTYMSQEQDFGKLCYHAIPAPKGFEGDMRPATEPREPSGSASDVRARGAFTMGQGWTIEMLRQLNTGADDDLAFSSNKPIDFSVTVADGAGETLTSDVYSLRLLD